MDCSTLPPLLATLRARIDGEVVSASRVVDGLLDLRTLAGTNRSLVCLADDALAEVGGRTVVTSQWWRQRLSIIERECEVLTENDEMLSEPSGTR